MKVRFSCFILLALLAAFVGGCATPLAEGKLYQMPPIAKEISASPNAIYYATRWAMDECGLPIGIEDLQGGVIESKWVPVSPATHYVDVFHSPDYTTAGSYYKMIITIIPQDNGKSKVEARTDVKSIVNNTRTTGEKERDILAKIALHARGYDINVTNLGVEDK